MFRLGVIIFILLITLPVYAESNNSDSKALQDLIVSAEQGNPTALLALGEMYFYGEGVSKDAKESAKWFRLAANKGNVTAQFKLGKLYERGFGGPADCNDYKESIKWYTLAANQGHSDSQIRLGLFHEHGLCLLKDPKEAIKWYTLAANQGHVKAQSFLGYMYEKGTSVPKDYNESIKWYTLAANQGDVYSQINLGGMYAKAGVHQNYVYAYMWYEIFASDDSNLDAYIGKTRQNKIIKNMIQSQIDDAQELAHEWVAEHRHSM